MTFNMHRVRSNVIYCPCLWKDTELHLSWHTTTPFVSGRVARICNGEGGCLSGLFAPHSNSVKPQLKWRVHEIRVVGVFENSVVIRGFSLCVFCTVPHVSSCIFFSHFEKHSEFQNSVNIFVMVVQL